MFGIKSLDAKFIFQQIEAARIAATRYKKEDNCGSRFFRQAHHQKPLKYEWVKGKSSRIFCGCCEARSSFEIAGVPVDVAKEALRLAAQKLPVKTKFIARDFEA